MYICAPLIDSWRWQDSVRIERVVNNLLSNAIKYSPGGGRISLEIRERSAEPVSEAILRVTDAGMCIAAPDLARIFEWFHRGSNAEKSSVGGTGLGLAGALQIVEHHGGRIIVESEEGKGSTFTVYLPLDAPVSHRRQISDPASEAAEERLSTTSLGAQRERPNTVP